MLNKAFVDDLSMLLNKHSVDALLGKPDFVLAAQLSNVLVAEYSAALDTARWKGTGVARGPAHFEAQDPEFTDVTHFNQKFGLLVGELPRFLSERKAKERADFLQEELDELRKGIAEHNIAEIADALIDIVYVAKGTAVAMGLPWRQLWADVHRANLAKVPGMTKRGDLMDVCKPEGWVGPKTLELLTYHGLDCLEPYCIEGADDEIYKAAAALSVDVDLSDPNRGGSTEQEPSEFTDWPGSENRGAPVGAKIVKVQFRSGEIITARAHLLRWEHIGANGDIVAFKYMPDSALDSVGLVRDENPIGGVER